jgi:rubredoxin
VNPDDATTVRTEGRSLMCLVCGWVYYEDLGYPEAGIPPGTRWADVPDTWTCPDCGAFKEDFVMAPL